MVQVLIIQLLLLMQTATTIDGGKITTGSITANQIAANTITAANIAASTLTTSQLNFTPLTSHQDISGKINSGSAAADVNSGSVSINANRISLTKGDIGLGNVGNTSVADIQSGTTAANVGLGNVANSTPANQLISGWSTTITAGGLSLGNSSGARIVLDASSSAPRIVIYDS